MKRKALSMILAFAMTFTLFTAGAGAAASDYSDTAGHWAEDSIERWSEYGVVQGSNGDFLPDGELTCAQLATILARLLNLPAAGNAGFTDSNPAAWYADAINRCAAAGILNGNGDGTVSPDATISRERAMVMMGRALGVEPVQNPDLTKYGDASKVAPYAQGMVAALIDAGIVGGVSDNELVPQGDINRASTVTILDRAITTYANKDGANVDVSEAKGITLIVAADVTVTGKVENLIIASTNSTVTLDGVTAEKITVAGESTKITMNDTQAKTVIANGEKTAVETTGKTTVETLTVTGESAVVKTTGSTTVANLNVEANGAAITTDGNTKVNNLTVSGENTAVKTEGNTKVESLNVSGEKVAVETNGSAKVESLNVSESAKDATVTAGTGTTIGKVENKAEGTTVKGGGTVNNVESNKNVSVETKGTKVDNSGDSKITVTDSDGKTSDVEKDSSASTSGTVSGGGSSHSHSYSGDWSYDETKHWHAPVCGHSVRSGEAAHTYNETTHKCECGAFSPEIVAAVNEQGYASLADAISAAAVGSTVQIISDVKNETLTIDKDITIEGSAENKKVLTDTIITASGRGELTFRNLKFTGNSYINTDGCEALTVEGCEADVTPTSITGRGAFIVLGTTEINNGAQGLALTVKNNTIIASKGDNTTGDFYAAAIFGWNYISKAEITGNTFGSEAIPYNFVAIKLMNATDGAEYIIRDNTIYGSNASFALYAIDLYQNNSRANPYFATIENNRLINTSTTESENDFYLVDVECNGAGNAMVNVKSSNTVNGSAATVKDILIEDGTHTCCRYAGIDVTVDESGKITGGVFSKTPSTYVADGYGVRADSNGTFTVEPNVYIGDRKYDTLTAAIAALDNNHGCAEIKIIKAGTCTLPVKALSNLTIVGVEGVVITCGDFGNNGEDATRCYTSVAFKNVTFAKNRWNAIFYGTNKIENCTFDVAENEYALRYAYVKAGGSLTIEGCTFNMTKDRDSSIHFDGDTGNFSMKNCTVNGGYIALAGTLENVNITECTLNGVRVSCYGDYVFTKCIFDKDCKIYVNRWAGSNITVSLTECSVSDGSAMKEICYSDDSNTNTGWTIKIDEDSYNTSSGLTKK